MMSIWGDGDPDQYPDDPFKIEPNWYPARAVECFSKTVDEGDGQQLLTIKWKIKLPGSRFDGLPVTDRNTFFTRDNESLTGEEIQRNAFLKRKLREGFDLGPNEIKSFEPRMALSCDAMIEVTNNPDKTNPDVVYNNVRGVLSKRLFEERYGKGDNEVSAMAQGGAGLLDEI
jgi:hypothetical protein